MEVVPVLVAFHSVHWIRVAVESYLQQFPGERILVVDNNPLRGESGWLPHCEEERDWLATHPGVRLVDGARGPDGRLPDGRLEHGAGMDVALAWCRRHGARVLLHFEPDCLVSGRGWRDNLLHAVAEGAWMAGHYRQSHGTIHPTPSAWQVAEVRASFKLAPWADDEERLAFRELVDVSRLATDNSPEGRWIRLVQYWDTGHKAWFDAAVQGRTAVVPIPGFTHYWGGSLARRFSAKTLAARFPEVQPFLEKAHLQQTRRQVERCSFREAVRDIEKGQVATCRLMQRMSGVTDPGWCEVSLDVCQACCATFRPCPQQPNPVVASLLYGLAEKVVARGGVPGCSAAEATALRNRVELNLEMDLP